MLLTLKNDVYSEKKNITCFFWAFPLIVRRFTATLMTILRASQYVEYLNAIIWLCVIAFCINALINSIVLRDLAIGIFVILFSFVASEIWPFNSFISENRLYYLTSIFPFFYIGKCLAADRNILKQMRSISVVVIFLNYLVYFLYYKRGGGTGIFNDNLAFAYDLVPHVTILFYYFLRDRKIFDTILFALAAVLLLMQGTRGPLLFLVVFFVWYTFASRPFHKWIVESVLLLFASTVFFYSGLFEKLIYYLINVGSSIGVSTRILETIVAESGTGLRSNYWREYLLNIAFQGIKERPYLGYGPYGDFYLTRNDTNFIGGMYVHNMIVEFMCDYGIIIGIALFTSFVLLLLKGYRSRKDLEIKIMIMLLISNTFFKFFFSGSYLQEPFFYVLLGFLASLKKNKQKSRKVITLGGKFT